MRKLPEGQQWKFRRMAAGITQKEIAEYLGYKKHSIISMFENEKPDSMTKENIEKYKKYIIDKENEIES